MMVRIDRNKSSTVRFSSRKHPRPAGRSREEVKSILRKAFRRKFPDDTVDISDGYAGNIHVMVVSRRFDKMTEKKKQDFMWSIVDQADLSEKEKRLISLLYPVSPATIP